ncbi:hypothetical protein ABPG72_021480 [Tetrahymena utriculariae]
MNLQFLCQNAFILFNECVFTYFYSGKAIFNNSTVIQKPKIKIKRRRNSQIDLNKKLHAKKITVLVCLYLASQKFIFNIFNDSQKVNMYFFVNQIPFYYIQYEQTKNK